MNGHFSARGIRQKILYVFYSMDPGAVFATTKIRIHFCHPENENVRKTGFLFSFFSFKNGPSMFFMLIFIFIFISVELLISFIRSDADHILS